MVFLIIFGVGFMLTVVTFIVGELFDLGDLGGDGADTLGADGASPFSSRVLFVFMTAFGGFGFIAQSADWALPAAVLAGLVGGGGVAAGTFFLIVLPMARQQGTTSFKGEDLIELQGEVVDDIPAGGLGRVSFLPPGTGARVSRAARSQSGGHIAPGTAVRVVNVGPTSITVAPVDYYKGARD
ncbi:MAG: hypothetical protein AB7T37_08815 [Dehalococcoidia bacterium]